MRRRCIQGRRKLTRSVICLLITSAPVPADAMLSLTPKECLPCYSSVHMAVRGRFTFLLVEPPRLPQGLRWHNSIKRLLSSTESIWHQRIGTVHKLVVPALGLLVAGWCVTEQVRVPETWRRQLPEISGIAAQATRLDGQPIMVLTAPYEAEQTTYRQLLRQQHVTARPGDNIVLEPGIERVDGGPASKEAQPAPAPGAPDDLALRSGIEGPRETLAPRLSEPREQTARDENVAIAIASNQILDTLQPGARNVILVGGFDALAAGRRVEIIIQSPMLETYNYSWEIAGCPNQTFGSTRSSRFNFLASNPSTCIVSLTSTCRGYPPGTIGCLTDVWSRPYSLPIRK